MNDLEKQRVKYYNYLFGSMLLVQGLGIGTFTTTELLKGTGYLIPVSILSMGTLIVIATFIDWKRTMKRIL